MIRSIKQKLVWGYTFVIVILMLLSSNASIHALNYITAHTFGNSLPSLLDMEIIESREAFTAWYSSSDRTPSIFDGEKIADTIVLECWFDRDNNLVMSEGAYSVAKALQEELNNWKSPHRKTFRMSLVTENATEWHMIMNADDVYDGDILLGKVLVGINLTPIIEITHQFIVVSMIIVVLVSIIAYFTGKHFAGRAVQPIEKAMRKQRDFVANASHELRTPLSIMLASIDMIDTNRDNEQTIRDIKDEILQMRLLLNSLLLLTQTEDGKHEFIDFLLNETVENAVKHIQIIADKKNINVILQMNGPVLFHGDQLKLQQLLGILLDNAFKYSPPDSPVTVEIKENPGTIEIEVTNQGEGIKEKDLEHIFERFYRADTARANTEGFGLGLPIAKLITELHNGTIKIKSDSAKGTTVSLLFPKTIQ